MSDQDQHHAAGSPEATLRDMLASALDHRNDDHWTGPAERQVPRLSYCRAKTGFNLQREDIAATGIVRHFRSPALPNGHDHQTPATITQSQENAEAKLAEVIDTVRDREARVIEQRKVVAESKERVKTTRAQFAEALAHWWRGTGPKDFAELHRQTVAAQRERKMRELRGEIEPHKPVNSTGPSLIDRIAANTAGSMPQKHAASPPGFSFRRGASTGVGGRATPHFKLPSQR